MRLAGYLPQRGPGPVGHASMLTTERYDNERIERLQAAILRLEAGKKFDAGAAEDNSSFEIKPDRASPTAPRKT